MLVAALVARGTCSDVLEYCVRQYVVISSVPLLDELRSVLTEKFHQRRVNVRAALQLSRCNHVAEFWNCSASNRYKGYRSV